MYVFNNIDAVLGARSRWQKRAYLLQRGLERTRKEAADALDAQDRV